MPSYFPKTHKQHGISRWKIITEAGLGIAIATGQQDKYFYKQLYGRIEEHLKYTSTESLFKNFAPF